MLWLTFVVLILFGLFKTFSAINNELQDGQSKFMTHCTTPNHDIGACVEIHNCPIFMEVLASGTFANYDFIRASECGNQDKKHPKVCCGNFNNYFDQITTIRPPQLPKPPSSNLFPKTCRTKFDRLRIMGGIEARLGEFPWMARLRHLRSDGLFSYGCSGFLITEKFVLTAAHCVRSKILEPLGPIHQVQLGEHNTETDPDCSMDQCSDPPQYLEIEEPIVHSGYIQGDPQQYHDIAVIPLKQTAKFTEFVQPLCLPSTLSQIEAMLVSGWGKTETKYESPIKLKVTVPKTNHSSCVNTYKPIGIRIQDSQVCAGGEEGRDSCTGDSGGPLMVYDPIEGWFAEGIVSFGKGCGLDEWPGVYTSIPYHMPWIEMVVNEFLEKNGGKHKESTTEIKEDYFVWGT